MGRKKSAQDSPFAAFERTFEGVKTRFEILNVGSKSSKILVYRGNAKEPIELDISFQNHSISVDGEKVANYFVCKERDKRTGSSKKSSISKRKRSKSKRGSEEHVALMQVDVLSDKNAIVKDTWFTQMKRFGSPFGRGVFGAAGWMSWVITKSLAFLYYEVIDWGPLSLPVIGFAINFFFPSYSAYVEYSGVLVISMINQPRQALMSLFKTIVLGKFGNVVKLIPGMGKLIEYSGSAVGNVPFLSNEVAKNGTVVYNGTRYQIVLKN